MKINLRKNGVIMSKTANSTQLISEVDNKVIPDWPFKRNELG